jgi:hypothetical protein
LTLILTFSLREKELHGRDSLLSHAKGALSSKPGATRQDFDRKSEQALKARFNLSVAVNTTQAGLK